MNDKLKHFYRQLGKIKHISAWSRKLYGKGERELEKGGRGRKIQKYAQRVGGEKFKHHPAYIGHKWLDSF